MSARATRTAAQAVVIVLRREFRLRPWLWRGVALTGAAAFGELLGQVLPWA